jgi:YggT family protein
VQAILITFIQMLVTVFWVLLIARVLMSWVNPMGGGALAAVVYQLTEPILAPIRRILPATGGLDWSPLVAMLLLGVVLRVIVRL